jgi:hypothetical protein
MPTAWEFILQESVDLDPFPDWIAPGKRVIAYNGEAVAWIVGIMKENNETFILLSWKPDPDWRTYFEPGGPQKWDLRALYKYWEPVTEPG